MLGWLSLFRRASFTLITGLTRVKLDLRSEPTHPCNCCDYDVSGCFRMILTKRSSCSVTFKKDETQEETSRILASFVATLSHRITDQCGVNAWSSKLDFFTKCLARRQRKISLVYFCINKCNKFNKEMSRVISFKCLATFRWMAIISWFSD